MLFDAVVSEGHGEASSGRGILGAVGVLTVQGYYGTSGGGGGVEQGFGSAPDHVEGLVPS